VIEHIQARIQHAINPTAAVAYMYFDYKDRARLTPEVILAGLIKQLVFRQTDSHVNATLSPHVMEMYDKMHHQGKRPAMSDLQELFISIAAEFSEVFLIFDALDECNEDERNVLLPFVMRLPLARKGDVRFRIMVTGRPYCADMQRAFADAAALELAVIPDNGDIELAVKEKLEAAKKSQRIPAQLELDIVTKVLEKADGM